MKERCVNNFGGKVLMMDAKAEDVNEYVRKNTAEQYEMRPDFEFRGLMMLLAQPMLVGLKIKKKKIILPFTKLCPKYGTVLYEIDATEEDFEAIRSGLQKMN
ncbi:MAG: DUF1894 domain-containing protein [Methanocalculus sp. MSAO_Arc1]|uniref:DUF1894 domain-containing protein n=1 Tax=Methanocalculus TaxID=71151 RepID=UPI000FF7B296|nr:MULTISPECIES: DUF1894 domain-containing protein [unclassified Methanocalculus]MCP1661480.1 hypothetical protein [Methanocalculus sp. AMF5]RQD79756.1 MAG: DUF1894 domain-containing protein [Methanocalculus sp. MSAO_Arc1]